MKTALACLNLIVERGAHCEVTPEDARVAIHAIETQALMAGALRLVVESPKNEAALDHGRKLLKLHDDYVRKVQAEAVARDLDLVVLDTAPNPVDSAPAKKVVAEQDVADLV